MSWKRKLAYGALLCLFLMLCLGASLWFSLPTILNSKPVLQYAGNAGLEGFSWKVCRIGLGGSDIGNMEIGAGQHKALRINTVQITYSLTGLRNGHLPAVRISGLELNCGIKDGNFFLQDFDLPSFLQRFSSQKDDKSSSSAIPPVSIEELELNNTLIRFAWEKENLRIPLNLRLHLGNRGNMDGVLTLFPGSQEIQTRFDCDFSTGEMQLAVQGHLLRTCRFSDLLHRVTGLSLHGELNLQAEARMRISPFVLSYLNVSGQFRTEAGRYGNMEIVPFSPEHPPFSFEARTADGKKWNLSASDLSLSSPFPFTLSNADGILNLSESTMEMQGNLHVELPKTEKSLPRMTEPLLSKGKFSVLSGKEGNWECSYTSFPDDADSFCNLQTGKKTAFVFRQPQFDISAKGQFAAGSFAYNINIAHLHMTQENFRFELPLLQAKGSGNFGQTLEMTASLSAPEIKLNAGKTDITAKNLSLSAKAVNPHNSDFRMNGEIKLSEGRVHEQNSKTLASGIRITFPFQWPWKKSEKKGEIRIGSAKLDTYSIGSLSGFVRQDAEGVNFGGKVKGTILAGLGADISGKYAFFSKNPVMDISLASRHQIKSPLDLGKFHKSAKGIQISGRLDLKAGMISDRNGLVCHADAAFTKANMRMGKEGPVIDGIDLRVSLPDLIALRSAPGQQMKFESLRMGNILLEKGDMRFQMESATSFLMEKAQFDWCKGRVNAQSLRVISGHDDYDLILHCDRLHLADVLEQLGAAKAKGEGTVNGRIPIRFAKGELIFDDGFLYSTPGEGGTIHLKPSELVMAGIPKDTPQMGQLELAAEALKDYEYQWVKMLLSSEGDDLMMRVSFDGKPIHPLPFLYKEEVGGFVRVESGGQLSRFQGIRLNVNLALPLNRILRYRGALDKYNEKTGRANF